jgi:serine protease Do
MEKTKKVEKTIKKEKPKKEKKRLKIDKNVIVLICTVFVTILIGIFIGTTSTYLFLRNTDLLNFEEAEEEGSEDVLVTDDEKLIIDVVEDSKDSVVSIAISELTFSVEEGIVDTTDNIGTGFVVDKGGLIITNQHVVSDTTADYKVITSSGDEYDVVKIVRDNVNDIALIKVDAEDLTPIELGDSENIVVGQTVIAIGTPLGDYSGTVTTGVISGLDRSVTTGASWFGDTAKDYENVIQTDAAVNPGNSGGPLLNTSGKVIGINFATTTNADNISFALPINIVKSRIEEYRTYGKFVKPYLGITYQIVSEYVAAYYSDVVAGVLILRVDPTSPAYDVGLKKGDIITHMDDESVVGSFSTVIDQYDPGDEVKITYYRDGESSHVNVTLAEAD